MLLALIAVAFTVGVGPPASADGGACPAQVAALNETLAKIDEHNRVGHPEESAHLRSSGRTTVRRTN